MGGSCAVTHQRRDAASGALLLRVLVLDVHLWARPDADEQRAFLHHPEAPEPGARGGGARGGAGAGGEWGEEELRTTFPFDVTRRDIVLADEDGDLCPTVVLAEDGLLLVVSVLRVSLSGWGWGSFLSD